MGPGPGDDGGLSLRVFLEAHHLHAEDPSRRRRSAVQ